MSSRRQTEQIHRLHFSIPFFDGGLYCAGKRDDPDAQARPTLGCADARARCRPASKGWAWATNCDDPAVIFPEANNNAWPSRARWPTIRKSFWPTNRPAISIPQTPSARSSCCRILCIEREQGVASGHAQSGNCRSVRLDPRDERRPHHRQPAGRAREVRFLK